MSAKSKEYELAIKIAGEIEKSFYDSTRLTKKELNDMAKHAANVSIAASSASGSITKNLKEGVEGAVPAFSSIEKVAKASFKAITIAAAATGAAVVIGLGTSVSAGVEFESAFAGVKKTVTATDAELKEIRNDLREMAKEEVPTSAAGLSAIAEAAGQLGIKTENISEFTKTMADLSVTTNLTAEEGATEFAKFANITKMPQDQFDELGSSVVELGNKLATTEADIVNMGMRIAAAGDQVHLSESDIMGYSAALSSVGIEAEAGGSAFSKLIANMQLAAETGEDLKAYAEVAGLTGEEFKNIFNQDASKAINSFLAGLKNTEKNGKSAIAVLEEMGLTEVRLRDTLLRAASASDLFDSALDISSQAWEKNTALVNEAEQRYATFESQTGILKNKISDIGISIYDDLKPGLTGSIELANGFVDSVAGQEDVIGNLIEAAVKGLPTMVREMKTAGKAIKEFANPFLEVGNWLVANPGVIVGTIAGIGTALATYKIGSGIMSLITSIGSLGPVGIAIMAIGGVAAVITGMATAVKKSADEAKKANLDQHFGNISLSLKELKDTASVVVKSKSLEKIKESISALGKLDGISEDINHATEALNKMNWKVSIGMELTENEKNEYKSQVQSFIDSTQEYATQQQYAVSISIGTLLGDDLESKNVVTQINDFYADKQQELADLGSQLNETITAAFQDGLLDIDETEEITKLQEQIARIKSTLAGSEFESGMDLLHMKYGGQGLDADSFLNLQDEIKTQMDEAMTYYDDAYKTSISRFRLMLSEGEWSQEQYNSASAGANAGYLQQKSEVQTKASSFMVDTITDQYKNELEDLLPKIKTELDSALQQTLIDIESLGNAEGSWKSVGQFINTEEIDKDTRAALKELWEGMKPQLEEMESLKNQYNDAGKEIPAELSKGIKEAAMLGILAEDQAALYAALGETARNSDEYKQTLQEMKQQGTFIPESIANAIEDNQGLVEASVQNLYKTTQQSITKTFNKGFSLPMELDMTPASILRPGYGAVKEGHADGGIFSVPHIAWFAEKGPEAAIPIDGSQNALDLWHKTGELLGVKELSGENNSIINNVQSAVYSGGSEREIKIKYNPTLQFYGDAPSQKEMEDVMDTEQEKFARLMDQYLKNNNRISFA